MGVLTSTTPRPEVLKGDLEDAIFAADFGDLIAGTAPKVYGDPVTFFQNTHPARALRNVVERVFERLAARKEPGGTMRLSTGFGGGKTHTLMALWHLAQHISDPSMGTELLPAAGRPKSVTVVGVDAGKAGVPLFSSHGPTKIHSLWGEIFYQLGGLSALKKLGKADDPEASPSEDQIRAAFPKGPVLLLLDELVVYMARLSDRGQGNLLGFLNSLSSVVGKRPQSMLVLTDPARQAAYAGQSATLASLVTAAATKLNELQSRKVSDFDPIGKEGARVIGRRLFQKVDPAGAQKASAAYHTLFERLAQEDGNPLYQTAASAEYAQRIVESYPFHPRLLDTAQDRLSAMADFQQSRGVLRLFARILRDVWERGEDVELITAGEVDWGSPRIQGDLLRRLQRDRFKAAVTADIEKHAAELDGEMRRGIHTRVASALLLESLPLQPTGGLDKADLTLAVLRPEEAGPEAAEALDRLAGVCWHTYPMEGGRGLQFRYEPNILKQIEERTRDIPEEDARTRVLADAQTYFTGPRFRLASWPERANQVSESAELQLVLCETPELAASVCRYSDDSHPEAPMPRRFRNAIVAIAPKLAALREVIGRAKRLLAAEKIEAESKTGDAQKLVREQLQRIKPELVKRFYVETRRAFDQLFGADGKLGVLGEEYQVPEDEILRQPQGEQCVWKFLNEKKLIYRPGDKLDLDLFLKKILPGATPVTGQPEVYSAKSIHEQFLRAPGMRILPDGQIVRETIMSAVSAGKLVVRLPDGRAFDAKGCVQGPEGNRGRTSETLGGLSLDDNVLVARAGSAAAESWTAVDERKKPEGETGTEETPPPVPPPPAVRSTFEDWDQILATARDRRLRALYVTVRSPAAAAALPGMVQPLGAESLSLSLMVGGTLKQGGKMNFAATDVRPTHPTRPLQTAQTIFNALADGGSYEAVLRLSFGSTGRAGLISQLEQLRENLPEDVAVRAEFAPAEEGIG